MEKLIAMDCMFLCFECQLGFGMLPELAGI